MHNLQKVFQIASESEHLKPPWQENPCSPPPHLSRTTQRAIDIYMLSQKPNGGMGGLGWWQAANGYTAMALHDLWSNTQHNYSALDRTIRQCEARQRGLINVFNDDTLWWAMLCMHMYSIKHDSWYLDIARGIWQHIRGGNSICGRKQVFFRDNDMEGAVYWTTKPHEDQINAISTSLFAELSVRLALVCRSGTQPEEGHRAKLSNPLHHSKLPSYEDYIEAARTSLGWTLRCRYRPRDAVVLDHIKLNANKAVDWTFTYNTGVLLGTCALMYEATRVDDYMQLACHIARKALAHKGWIEPDGVLTEKGAYGHGTHDPIKDNDSVGFKAVLVRQLGVLFDVVRKTACGMPVARETAEAIKVFINVNFQSQVERNTNGNGQYGPWWAGPFECPTSHSQMAALDVMAAVRLVNA